MKKAHETYISIKNSMKKVVIGKDEVIDLVLISLLCGGHILLDDVPGTGKTRLASALADAVGCAFRRVQFTPDLLPADLTGVNIFNMKKSEFEFVPGPVFCNILLADEINRATPKTQSGLLECMEEKQVTVDGVTRSLALPFIVIATQNPVDNMGTFPLPEAQLDRFLIKTSMGYPTHEETNAIIAANAVTNTRAVRCATIEDIKYAAEKMGEVYAHPDIINYITTIIEVTRGHREVVLGAGTRAGIHLLKVAKGFAFSKGRSYVLPDDVKAAAIPVLAHRLILTNSARIKKDEDVSIIRQILEVVPVPTEAIFESGEYR